MGSHILFDVDFEARKGLITVIVGPNGSGKSTLLKSLFGLCTIHSGTVRVRGTDITRMPPHEVARRKIAYLPQVDNVFANLTVRENLVMAGYTLDSREARGRIPPLLETFPVLARLESARAGVLSGGERQMLGMAMALVRRPTIMLFDEPTASLSPRLAGEVMDKIREVKESLGITVILVEQNVRRSLGHRRPGVPTGQRQERLRRDAGRAACEPRAGPPVPGDRLVLDADAKKGRAARERAAASGGSGYPASS